ncbi:hypothetical protein GYMLUDRAFT_49067 [Collybiopsis luxurians FD-317 M1]|uniref:Uncharacterized protein n=1 Tax=Collybiopsis luxurians FD-317 M1 TaxID=944289 RepID=A0A0D0C7W1_9AGAR|nr:hypothetical protein GYMLUDRAFT_49067 [Collybiopsis luxurians FD-317 M1]
MNRGRGGHFKRKDGTWKLNLHAPTPSATTSRATTPTTSTQGALDALVPITISSSPSTLIANLEALTLTIPDLSAMTDEQTNVHLNSLSSSGSASATHSTSTLPGDNVTMETGA